MSVDGANETIDHRIRQGIKLVTALPINDPSASRNGVDVTSDPAWRELTLVPASTEQDFLGSRWRIGIPLSIKTSRTTAERKTHVRSNRKVKIRTEDQGASGPSYQVPSKRTTGSLWVVQFRDRLNLADPSLSKIREMVTFASSVAMEVGPSEHRRYW